ncbi:endo alpha-1,4 polygalactosaminidase [Chitinimonas lacunae]|uniref:Endo alpha-1,4 polygalactosaminidase n=1 Tax=Chitinimonas lacunae TaxID=1963018 RepID=A0ABV8MRI9_9NEIS
MLSRAFRLLLCLLSLAATAAPWRPVPNAVWHLQMSYLPSTVEEMLTLAQGADVIEVDAFDVKAEMVAGLKAAGRHVVCYINVGAWENWRADRNGFPAVVKGSAYAGWPGENWLDIRRLDILGPLMTARLTMARDKGCDGVDPDNINGYENPTGFPLKYADQLTYNRWLAQTAHSLGLGIGQKNALYMVADLVADYDWATIESCYAGKWCGRFEPFVQNGKAVLQIEYDGHDYWLEEICPEARTHGFSALFSNRELDGWKAPCNVPLAQLDKLLDLAQHTYPATFSRPRGPSASWMGYYFRCYDPDGVCLGAKGDGLFFYAPGSGVMEVGPVRQFLSP